MRWLFQRGINMPTDRLQRQFEVGSLVSVVGVVTAIGGTPAQPTVTISTKYVGFDGNPDTVGPVDSIQVVLENEVPRS